MKIHVVFSQSHVNFRYAELSSLCDLLKIDVDLRSVNEKSATAVLEFVDERDVLKLLSRAMLIKFCIALFYNSGSYVELEKIVKEDANAHMKMFNNAEVSYALRLFSLGKKKKIESCERLCNFAEFLQLDDAKVDLKTPKTEFYLIEEYENPTDLEPHNISFGRLIGEGQGSLKTQYNLQKRVYIGNTTMDPELSFIQSNIAQVGPGKVVIDPFVGTGGLLLPAAHFGAYVLGTEINYQTAKALGKPSRQGVAGRTDGESIWSNFVQQNTQDKLLGIMIADSSNHGIWHHATKFDVIVSDPPYGVREKALKVSKNHKSTESEHFISLPQKEEYVLENTFCDLINLAANFCEIGGRLSFWFPVVLQTYCEDSIPRHPAMELVHNCEQPLTRKTSRRLLTYRKIREPKENEVTSITSEGVSEYRKTLFDSVNVI